MRGRGFVAFRYDRNEPDADRFQAGKPFDFDDRAMDIKVGSKREFLQIGQGEKPEFCGILQNAFLIEFIRVFAERTFGRTSARENELGFAREFRIAHRFQKGDHILFDRIAPDRYDPMFRIAENEIGFFGKGNRVLDHESVGNDAQLRFIVPFYEARLNVLGRALDDLATIENFVAPKAHRHSVQIGIVLQMRRREKVFGVQVISRRHRNAHFLRHIRNDDFEIERFFEMDQIRPFDRAADYVFIDFGKRIPLSSDDEIDERQFVAI